MPFDVKKFTRQEFLPREGEVRVPQLKEYFDEGEEPIWKVRGLTHAEIAKGVEAWESRQKTAAVLDVISMNARESAETVKAMLGMDQSVPKDTAQRLEHFVLGSIQPEVKIGDAVHMAKAFPLLFIELTNKIYQLCGMGAEAKKKPIDSGDNQISKIA